VPLRDFLRSQVYSQGARMLPAELIRQVTGGPLDPAPLLAQLRAKYGEIYGF
jgi:carboxypeptidase Taq